MATENFWQIQTNFHFKMSPRATKTNILARTKLAIARACTACFKPKTRILEKVFSRQWIAVMFLEADTCVESGIDQTICYALKLASRYNMCTSTTNTALQCTILYRPFMSLLIVSDEVAGMLGDRVVGEMHEHIVLKWRSFTIAWYLGWQAYYLQCRGIEAIALIIIKGVSSYQRY